MSLLGVAMDYPVVAYDSNGTTTYDPGSQQILMEATPKFFRETSASPVRSFASGTIQFGAKIDSSGNLIGDLPGDDLLLTGDLDIDGDGSIDVSGTLLTGEVLAFGFEDVGVTDKYDFRFVPTGGAMVAYFAAGDIAVTVTSEHSSFAGDFTVAFDGGAKGNVGSTGIGELPAGIDIEKYVKVACAGGEGLTPGYWKQCQHFDDWTDYSPRDKVEEVFGINVCGNPTLLDALKAGGGGGVNALLRHSVAALLNAAHPNIDYAYSVDEVITMVQQAFATGQFEATKDLFEAQNELGADLKTPACKDEGPGEDADDPTGPTAKIGQTVSFTYIVTNTGEAALSNVTVTDDNATPGDTSDDFSPAPVLSGGFNVGDLNHDGLLDVGEEWQYAASAVVTAGQHVNVGTVVGTPVDPYGRVVGPDVTDAAPAHWYGSCGCVKGNASISGYVFLDKDNNGRKDCGESGIKCVKIILTGTDVSGRSIERVAYTDCSGKYSFSGLLAGTYTVTEVQPSGYQDGKDSVGTAGGVLGNDVISKIDLLATTKAQNYNFGELQKKSCGCGCWGRWSWGWKHDWSWGCNWSGGWNWSWGWKGGCGGKD